MYLIKWLYNYIFYYIRISKLLQDQKTELLFLILKNKNFCQLFALKTKVLNPIIYKLASSKIIQNLLLHSLYLVHLNLEFQIFINLDINKEFMFKIIIYHLKRNLIIRKYLIKKIIKLILFLNPLFNLAKTYYWSTRLKLTNIV